MLSLEAFAFKWIFVARQFYRMDYMAYLPLKFEPSTIFARKIIAVRPEVHITLSNGTLPGQTEHCAGTTAPIFELAYSRKNAVCGEVDRIPVELRPGYSSLGFMRQVTGHSEYSPGEEVSLYSIWVAPGAFDSFCESVCGKAGVGFHSFQKGPYSIHSFKSGPREESIIKRLDACFLNESDNLNKLMLESYILELLSINIEKLLCLDCSSKHLTKSDRESLAYARELLLSRLDCPPSLVELSRLIHMNDCKLKRAFKECFGQTVYQFVREQRLEKAFSLLEEGGHNVSQAAFAVGYTNIGHFSEIFQKRFGIMPKVLCK